MIRAIIFDLDGTLVQTERLKAVSYAKAAQTVCKVGCLHDKACIRKCSAKAIAEVDGVVTIDQKKCVD